MLRAKADNDSTVSTDDIKSIVDEVLKSGPATVEEIFSRANINVIIFEVCQEQLKFNTYIENANAKNLFFLAFNESNVIEVFLSLSRNGKKEIMSFFNSEENVEMAKQIVASAKKNYAFKGICSFSPGTVVSYKDIESLFCGIDESRAVLMDTSLNYIQANVESLEPNIKFTTSETYLQNRYNEVAKHRSYPMTFTYEINNFSEQNL